MRVVALALFLALLPAKSETLSVADFGARGDAVRFACSAESGSEVVRVTSTNQFSSADIGKVALLFGVGDTTTETNHQDIVARVLSVSAATNLTLSAPAGLTASALGILGTDNTTAFRSALAACASTNDTIAIPAGTFMMVPPLMLTNYVMSSAYDVIPSVVIQRGGVTFSGVSPEQTILMGCGAWRLLGSYASRGSIFECLGTVTNNYPLVFENLTMDGGVSEGLISYRGFPARVTDGLGWDVTHGALVDIGVNLHNSRTFRNCNFQHWRGEILKSGSAWVGGFNTLTNCVFFDGNASALNLTSSHLVSACRFDSLDMAMEFYEGYMVTNSVFENSVLTNLARNGIVIVGALTNHAEPNYLVSGNSISAATGGMLISAGANLTITSNAFFGSTFGIYTSSPSYQGTDWNHDWEVSSNLFTGVYEILSNGGTDRDRLEDAIFHHNTITTGCGFIVAGVGESRNVTFSSNTAATGQMNSTAFTAGQYCLDDGSNSFLPFLDVVGGADSMSTITCGRGARHQIYSTASTAAWALQDAPSSVVPDGAVISIENLSTSARLVFMSSALYPLGYSVSILPGASRSFRWRGTGWMPSNLVSARVVAGGVRGL